MNLKELSTLALVAMTAVVTGDAGTTLEQCLQDANQYIICGRDWEPTCETRPFVYDTRRDA